MAKDKNEWNDISNDSAVADLSGRRHGRVSLVLQKGLFRISWADGDPQVLPRESLLARYTAQSAGFSSKF